MRYLFEAPSQADCLVWSSNYFVFYSPLAPEEILTSKFYIYRSQRKDIPLNGGKGLL